MQKRRFSRCSVSRFDEISHAGRDLSPSYKPVGRRSGDSPGENVVFVDYCRSAALRMDTAKMEEKKKIRKVLHKLCFFYVVRPIDPYRRAVKNKKKKFNYNTGVLIIYGFLTPDDNRRATQLFFSKVIISIEFSSVFVFVQMDFRRV